VTATWIRDGMWDLWAAALTSQPCTDPDCDVCNPPTKEPPPCATPKTTPQPPSSPPSCSS